MVSFYENLILKNAKATLAVLFAIIATLSYFTQEFRIDASSDSLTLEHDEELRYYQEISEEFESNEFAFVAYSKNEEIFSKENLSDLKNLRTDLEAIPNVDSVVTLLDVPLLKNPPGSLSDLSKNIKTIDSGEANIELAKTEFRDSPIYTNLLISPDLKSTALQVNFKRNEEHVKLLERRAQLRDKKLADELTPAEIAESEKVELRHRQLKDLGGDQRHQDITSIRNIIDKYRVDSNIRLGGVPMIVDDILSFIRGDLFYFGIGLILFLILTLTVIFRKKRWVLLPLACCTLSGLTMIGILGLLHWDVTVVSSNFISLQLIFTMSLAIHIVVRYREFLLVKPEASNEELVKSAVKATLIPCLYASLTTIAGFTSLVICDILPVVNFGWMMTIGLCISFLVTFTLLPSILILLKKPEPHSANEFGVPLTSLFARLTEKKGTAIFITATIMACLTVFGVTRLEVENSFIDYFKKSTEIYKGMKFIDQELGGTTPMDVVIKFPKDEVTETENTESSDDSFDDFAEFDEEPVDQEKYWFTQEKLQLINKVHDYLEDQPAIGKVLSLATLEKTTREMNDGKEFDNFTLSLIFGQMPDRFKELLVDPYVSLEKSETRLTMRIKDSLPGLRRDDMLKQINTDLHEKLGIEKDNFRVTGLMVLYNNMLQSLFDSQIKTIGWTVGALFLMFLLLFRSLPIAIIAIIPSLLSSVGIVGLMGLLGIPLDLMTITIVAISIGIAVDDTIHYIHRFKDELKRDGDYTQAMHRSHRSIGSAMYYTSLTITMGFSILALSNFIPTILFGLLTALSMIFALVASLSLLPRLLMAVKPFEIDA